MNKEKPWIIFVSTKFCQSFPPAQYISSLHCLSQGKLGLEQLTSIGKSVPSFRKIAWPVTAWIIPKANLGWILRSSLIGESGLPAVVPGKPEKSELLVRVRSQGVGRMPKKGKALSPDEISLLEQWIREGASYAKHWAYILHRVPQFPLLPPTISSQIPSTLSFSANCASCGWEPSVPASPEIWLRRVSLGLTGLPPSVEQIDDFLAEDSPEVREQVVDHLLNSPRYGEHWARQWLDLARYADSNGFQADQLRDSWAYRDWVIEAMNADLPFDQFTIEQLAGDLLPEPSPDQRIATGFHRTSTCNAEAGVHPEENRVNQVFDRVNTTGLTWLGATLECAQCHSHKYDPISQEEYYQFFAFFNNTPLEVENKSGAGVSFDFWGPKMELPTSVEEQAKRTALKDEMDKMKRELKVEEKRSEEQFCRLEDSASRSSRASQ